MSKNKYQKGYTLLFAVLTAALVLGVAAFVAGVARKQFIISSVAKNSALSFYNADSAISCITQSLVWDGDVNSPATITCNGHQVSFDMIYETEPIDPSVPETFYYVQEMAFYGDLHSTRSVNGGWGIPIDFGSNGCALTKVWIGLNSSSVLTRIYESRGYSSPCDNTSMPGITKPSSNPRNVERAIRVTQQ